MPWRYLWIYIHVEAPCLFITTVFIVQLTTVYFKPFKHFISNLFSVQGYNNQNWSTGPIIDMHCNKKGKLCHKNIINNFPFFSYIFTFTTPDSSLQLHTTHTHTRLSSVASVPGILGRLLSGGRSLPAILVGNQSSAG